ncbi:hypothetical protein FRB94_005795 [Tulasnella sp. JGI-2019a]|nr:hypothetical protein FRB94_005795 [Tulasnella sp. JGI-2019a]
MPLKSTNFRIRQLAGSTSSGAWVTSDWVPLMARGGQEVGTLPHGRGNWVERLELSANKSAQEIQSNPAITLMAFFKSLGTSFENEVQTSSDADEFEAGGFQTLSLEKSMGKGSSLESTPELTEKDVHHWTDYWRTKGFLQEI